MILGMPAFTFFHVLISLIAILSGVVVLLGLLADRRLNGCTALFLLTTVLTSVTGFFFPYHGVTPGIVLGIISIVVLAIAIFARYSKHLAGGWRKTYVISAVTALYLNVFVLIAQSFKKVPALNVLAPTQTEAPFKIAQLVNLVLFVILTIAAAVRFHDRSSNRA